MFLIAGQNYITEGISLQVRNFPFLIHHDMETFFCESNWANFISVEYETNSSSKLSKGNLR